MHTQHSERGKGCRYTIHDSLTKEKRKKKKRSEKKQHPTPNVNKTKQKQRTPTHPNPTPSHIVRPPVPAEARLGLPRLGQSARTRPGRLGDADAPPRQRAHNVGGGRPARTAGAEGRPLRRPPRRRRRRQRARDVLRQLLVCELARDAPFEGLLGDDVVVDVLDGRVGPVVNFAPVCWWTHEGSTS